MVAEAGDDDEDQEEGGDGHEHVDQSHDDALGQTTEVACRTAGDRADGQPYEHGYEADRQRYPPAGQDAGEHVSAQLVGP